MRSRTVAVIGMAVGYGLVALIGMQFSLQSTPDELVSPASGLALAAFLWFRPRLWPWLSAGVFLGSFAVRTLESNTDSDPVVGVCLAALHALEPALAAFVVQRFTGPGQPLGDLRRIILGLVVAAVGVSAATALVAAAIHQSLNHPPGVAHGLQWWLASGLGMLVVTPLALVQSRRVGPTRLVESAVALMILTGLTATIFWRPVTSRTSVLQYLFLLFPIAVWIARRLRPWAVTSGLVMTTLIATLGTLHGYGPFMEAGIGTAAFYNFQMFLVTLALLVLVLVADVDDKRTSETQIRRERAGFAAVLDAATEIAIVATDREGIVTVFNRGAEHLLGYAPEDVIGTMTPEAFFDAEELAARAEELGVATPLFALASPSETGRAETRRWTGIRKDGTRVPIELTLTAIRGPDGSVTGIAGVSRDLTREELADMARRAAEVEFRAAFEGAPAGMALVGLDGRIERANVAMADLLGYSPDELVGVAADSLTVTVDDTPTEFLIEDLPGGVVRYSAESVLRHRDGHTLSVLVNGTELPETDGNRGRYLGHVIDISDRKNFEHRLRHLADHDALTGLANRRRLESELERHLALGRRFGHDGSLLILDLDNLKFVNDTLGHRRGDEILTAVARILADELRESDLLARLGGDEFAVLAPRTNGAGAAELGERLRAAVSSHCHPDLHDLTVSIGVAECRDFADAGAEAIIMAADLAMYDAKDAGKNRVALAGSSVDTLTTRNRITWVQRVETALKDDRLRLVAQPIVDMRSGKVVRQELLIRLLSDRGDLIPSAVFLPSIEQSDLITRVDAWVVREAASILATSPDPELHLEVNLSGRSLGNPELLEIIEDELGNTGIDPSRLTFAVSETAAISNLAAARAFADRLRILGCRFALDNFGGGFGSFYYLKHLPFDDVKIDGEFVRHCVENEADRLFVKAIVGIARGLGRRTVAEFVEDAPTLALLQELGVDDAQGNLLGVPTPIGTDSARGLVPRTAPADPPTSGAQLRESAGVAN